MLNKLVILIIFYLPILSANLPPIGIQINPTTVQKNKISMYSLSSSSSKSIFNKFHTIGKAT